MSPPSDPRRRRFLKLSASAGGASMLAQLLPGTIAEALAIEPDRRHGSIQDVDHVVILMQENRSFDHYFGRLRGVRGFGDPRPLKLAADRTVWEQPGNQPGEVVLPFHPETAEPGLAFIEDLPHGWNDTHAACNGGRNDGWVPAKGTTTMAYLERRDIPFHYALADAFTICDAYHCSLIGSTDPNRYYLWTGYVGADGAGGGPVVDNAEAGYGWMTYPERLEQAGVSWKIYQDIGEGLDAAGGWGWTKDPYIGNYGDNSLLYFNQYRDAAPDSPLYQKARTGTHAKAGEGYFDQLRQDVLDGTLPQVSWIAAPEAFSEHPNWPANYGAWYIANVLAALTANPKLWSRTALFITYDENDGFFDHVAAPMAAGGTVAGASTVDTAAEHYTPPAGGSYVAAPYGLGPRVPMLVVSPWSRGGWVCSETFDHTSIIRFLEQRFGVHEPNISPWRRAVCGDLTRALDFSGNQPRLPRLPDTAGYAPPDRLRHPSYRPTPPEHGRLPTQEAGLRPARALPYALQVDAQLQPPQGKLSLGFANQGQAGAALWVVAEGSAEGPWSYTVEPGKQLQGDWACGPGDVYALSVHGPNGFLREFRGEQPPPDSPQARPEVELRFSDDHRLWLTLRNDGQQPCHMVVHANAYQPHGPRQYRLLPGARVDDLWDIEPVGHWYDLSVRVEGDARFLRRLAGHHETGRDSVSDPAYGLG